MVTFRGREVIEREERHPWGFYILTWGFMEPRVLFTVNMFCALFCMYLS